MAPVLVVDDLSKRYASYSSNLQRFAGWFGAKVTPSAELWPVRDMSFAVGRGEAIAIIGRNGAGKSTLLKLITGTIRPTQGTVDFSGSINAILELGLGFNPEFTGRQNVFFAGGLMGFSQRKLAELLPAIEAFAEIGEFFDRPLRVYSSGMQARLAFALVTAERPDLLIIDEVLAVGDSYFQHKCFDRIRRFKEEGSAILLVSHSMGDVRALCDRVILIDKGRVLMDGEPDMVVEYYNALIASEENSAASIEQKRQEDGWSHTRSGTFEVYAKELALLDAETREPVSIARVGQPLLLRLVAHARIDVPCLVLGYMLRDRAGHVVWGTNTWHMKQALHGVRKDDTVVFEMRFTCSLGQGSYSVSPALTGGETHLHGNYEWSDNALVFDVVNSGHPYFIGSSWLDAEFTIDKVDN